MPDNLERRRELRSTSTDAERRLWRHLRDRRFEEFKFRREHQIGPYIVDFICVRRGLVIEVDGSQHYNDEGLARDRERTRYLEAQGLQVLRFTNVEVLTNTAGVFDVIWAALIGRNEGASGRPPSP
ncbi:MAG: endonuclease domain-containing protein [Dehalococcoidia bacterium]